MYNKDDASLIEKFDYISISVFILIEYLHTMLYDRSDIPIAALRFRMQCNRPYLLESES